MSQPNTTLTEQESGWVNECAGRLRLIQADAATIAPEKRREYLQEEISRSVKSVPPANRKRYLEALLNRFPVAGQILSSTASAAPPPPPAPVIESPVHILERFVAAAAKLPEEKRAEFAKRLYEAGFAWVDRDALVLEIPDDLRQKLRIPAGQQPRLNRTMELLALLVWVFYELDRTALRTLSDLSARSPLLERRQDFRSVAGQFLTSDSDSPIEPQVRAISGLVGELLVAMLGGGREFGKQFVEKYSPEAIQDVVTGEGRGGVFGPNKRELCWKKYCDLAKDIETADAIDRWLKDCLGRFIDSKAKAGR
jgi:hypothetical protein